MSVTIWDKIATLTPTRDAAVANSGGDAFEARTAGGDVLIAPPPMLDGVSDRRMPDLRGRKYGDLTVLGQRAKMPGDGKHRATTWVVRCVCGNYALRRHDKIVHADPAEPAACPTCTYTRQMLARDTSSKGASKKQRAKSAARLDRLAGCTTQSVGEAQ